MTVVEPAMEVVIPNSDIICVNIIIGREAE